MDKYPIDNYNCPVLLMRNKAPIQEWAMEQLRHIESANVQQVANWLKKSDDTTGEGTYTGKYEGPVDAYRERKRRANK